jgi:hypothetical protein
MASKITRDVIESYLNCRYKVFGLMHFSEQWGRRDLGTSTMCRCCSTKLSHPPESLEFCWDCSVWSWGISKDGIQLGEFSSTAETTRPEGSG